jgi:hypothetical protein
MDWYDINTRLKSYVTWASDGSRKYVWNSAVPASGRWSFYSRPVDGGPARRETVSTSELEQSRAWLANPSGTTVLEVGLLLVGAGVLGYLLGKAGAAAATTTTT